MIGLAVYPFRKNERLIAQSGLFTMHVTDRKGIEQQIPDALQKVVIPKGIIEELKTLLDLAGLNKYTIYRDLDSLSLVLRKFHKI